MDVGEHKRSPYSDQNQFQVLQYGQKQVAKDLQGLEKVSFCRYHLDLQNEPVRIIFYVPIYPKIKYSEEPDANILFTALQHNT